LVISSLMWPERESNHKCTPTGENKAERDLGFQVARVLLHHFQSRHQGKMKWGGAPSSATNGAPFEMY
jgi:hypothetical protein